MCSLCCVCNNLFCFGFLASTSFASLLWSWFRYSNRTPLDKRIFQKPVLTYLCLPAIRIYICLRKHISMCALYMHVFFFFTVSEIEHLVKEHIVLGTRCPWELQNDYTFPIIFPFSTNMYTRGGHVSWKPTIEIVWRNKQAINRFLCNFDSNLKRTSIESRIYRRYIHCRCWNGRIYSIQSICAIYNVCMYRFITSIDWACVEYVLMIQVIDNLSSRS